MLKLDFRGGAGVHFDKPNKKRKRKKKVSPMPPKSEKDYSNIGFWLYVVGIVILIFANLWLLNKGTNSTPDDIYYTVLINLFGVCLVIGGWWMRSSEEKQALEGSGRKKPNTQSAQNSQNGQSARERDKSSSCWDENGGGGGRPNQGEAPSTARLGARGRRSLEEEEAHVAAEIQQFLDKGTGGPTNNGTRRHEFLEKFHH